MSRFISISITDETKPITQAGFGLGFILDPVADSISEYDYTEVRSTDDIPTSATELAEGLANAYLSQSPNPGVVAMQGVYIDETDGTATDVGDALDQVVEENNDWYGLLLADRTQTEIEAADSWIPANKLFVTQPVEAEWTGTLDTYALTSNKTSAFPSTTEQHADAAIMSVMFTKDAGSASWKFQTLSGVGSSGYTSADVSSMLSAGEGEPYMNPIIHELGVDYTAGGYTVTGGFIDVQEAIDWLDARLTENIFNLFINEEVSYTNKGIIQVISRMDEVFKQAVRREVIATEDGEGLYERSFPLRQDIPTNDRANRVLPDIDFEITAAGAIHEVDADGAVKV